MTSLVKRGLIGLATIVTSIILLRFIFVAIHGPGLDHSKEAQAEAQAYGFLTALQAYHSKYGVLPLVNGEDIRVSDATYDSLVDCLAGLVETSCNSARIRFIDEGTLHRHDPWGRQFRILLDGDGSGSIGVDGQTFSDSITIYSRGPNGRDDGGQGDDIVASKEAGSL